MTPVAAELKELLTQKPLLTIGVAESLTAGHLQVQIGSVSGSSEYFRGGVTAYTLEQKVKLLGVNRAHAKKVNCVSQRVAVEMAAGAMKLFKSHISVATTGYAEPSPANGVKVPFAWWAVCYRQRGGNAVISGLVEIHDGNRTDVQVRVAAIVLAELVAYLRAQRE